MIVSHEALILVVKVRSMEELSIDRMSSFAVMDSDKTYSDNECRGSRWNCSNDEKLLVGN